jgi:hypothetical protein
LFGTALPNTDIDAMAGIRGFETASSIRSFPLINISGYAAFVGPPSDHRPKQDRIRAWQYRDGVTYTSGEHDLKFGFELVHVANAFLSGTSAMGTFNFVGTYSGNGMADFLLGLPDNVVRADALNLWGAHGKFEGFYVQDNYRVSQNLTLNLSGR